MNQADLIKLAIAGAVSFAAYKYSSNVFVKAAAAGVIGVMVAKRLPITAWCSASARIRMCACNWPPDARIRFVSTSRMRGIR